MAMIYAGITWIMALGIMSSDLDCAPDETAQTTKGRSSRPGLFAYIWRRGRGAMIT
jgi:hypothetical protein